MFRPALVLLLLALGCAGPEYRAPTDAHVCTAPEFSSEQRAAIAGAVEDWNASGTHMVLTANADDCDLSFEVVEADALPEGVCASTGFDVTEVGPCGLASLAQVARHELGHFLTGPVHSSDERDIMFVALNAAMAETLTARDRARLNR